MPDSPNTLHCEASTPDLCLIPSHRRGLFLLHLNISRAPLPVRPVISTSGGQQSLSEPARHSTSTGLAGAVHQGHGTSFTHQNWVIPSVALWGHSVEPNFQAPVEGYLTTTGAIKPF